MFPLLLHGYTIIRNADNLKLNKIQLKYSKIQYSEEHSYLLNI